MVSHLIHAVIRHIADLDPQFLSRSNINIVRAYTVTHNILQPRQILHHAPCNRGVLVEQDIGLCTLPDQLIFGFALEEHRMYSSRRKDTLLLFKVFVVAVCDIYVHNLFTPALIAPS